MTNGNQKTYDFEGVARQWQELWMDNYAAMTRNVVGSEAFATASSAGLDWSLAWQRKMREATGQYLESLDIPRRSDLARLSRQIHASETRVADCEEAIDSLREEVQAGFSQLTQQLATLQAALESQPKATETQKKSSTTKKSPTTKKSSTSRRKSK